MASEYGDVFAAAIAVAISPVPIVAVILILFSEHSRRNGILYLLGWVLGLLICIGAVLILPEGLDFNRGSTLAPAGATLRLVTGLLFVAAAFAVWLRRPKTGEAHPLPAWTNRIEGFSGVQALLLAIGLAVINPKNLALAFSVILSIAEAGAPAGAGAPGAGDVCLRGQPHHCSACVLSSRGRQTSGPAAPRVEGVARVQQFNGDIRGIADDGHDDHRQGTGWAPVTDDWHSSYISQPITLHI